MEERKDNRPIKEIFPEARDVIEYAFTLGGKDYFEFSDFNSVPCGRGFAAIEYYNELAMRCTRDFLIVHNQAIKDIIDNNKNGIKLTDLVELHRMMDERLQWLHEPQIAAKILSVVFFTAEENPYRHDYSQASKKAKIFLDVQLDDKQFDFFFAQPIVKCLPYITSWSKDFPEYCQTIIAINKTHIESISSMLSEESKRIASYKSLLLQTFGALA